MVAGQNAFLAFLLKRDQVQHLTAGRSLREMTAAAGMVGDVCVGVSDSENRKKII